MSSVQIAGSSQLGKGFTAHSRSSESECRVLICLLGDFRVLTPGESIWIAGGSKTEILLSTLALRHGYFAVRDVLINALWPNREATLARQSLNSLVYSLHRSLGEVLGGAPPIAYIDGAYRLNVDAGVGVDVKSFDSLVDAGQHHAKAGNRSTAVELYTRALKIYRGDLRAGNDIHAILERERLSALYLNLLMYMADFYFAQGDYTECLDYSRALLASDPIREDAHRLVMRCYMRRGERAQALRQYQLCQEILRSEFDAVPEPASKALFDQIRLDPADV